MTEKTTTEFLARFKTRPRPTADVGNVIPLVKPAPKPQSKRFGKFVQLPMPWVETLRHSSGATYELSITILAEEFKQRQIDGEIVLTAKTTGMSHTTRYRAIDELVKLGLIRVRREGRHAIRVIELCLMND